MVQHEDGHNIEFQCLEPEITGGGGTHGYQNFHTKTDVEDKLVLNAIFIENAASLKTYKITIDLKNRAIYKLWAENTPSTIFCRDYILPSCLLPTSPISLISMGVIMKKTILATGSICILIAVVLVYQLNYSFSGVIKKEGFTKHDMIHAEGYSMDAEHLTKVMLLANDRKLGIMGITNQGFGIWKNQNMQSILMNPPMNKFVVAALPIMNISDGEGYSETHIFVAAYVNSPTKP